MHIIVIYTRPLLQHMGTAETYPSAGSSHWMKAARVVCDLSGGVAVVVSIFVSGAMAVVGMVW